MKRGLLAVGSLVVVIAGLIVAVVAIERANDRPVEGFLSPRSVSEVRQRMQRPSVLDRDQVRSLLGRPDSILYERPRGELWVYSGPSNDPTRPFLVRLWFGPKRNVAGMAYSGPPLHRAA